MVRLVHGNRRGEKRHEQYGFLGCRFLSGPWRAIIEGVVAEAHHLATVFVFTYAPWLLFVWLAFETIWDLRRRDIPMWFSLAMIIPGLILIALDSLILAGLIILSLLATEIRHRYALPGIIGMYGPIILIPFIKPDFIPFAFSWGVLMTIWLLGVIGGADALAGLSLMLFFPSWEMLTLVVLGILVWSVLYLIVRYGKFAGLRLWTVAMARAPGTKVAGIGAYALAAFALGVLHVLGVALV